MEAKPANKKIIRAAVVAVLLLGCGWRSGERWNQSAAQAAAQASGSESKEWREARERMVREQIAARGIHDPRLLEALRKIPRHLFVPPQFAASAYDDSPLPIGHGQTISQPYVVAFMSEALELKPQDKALEIGTGSGYQAAVLALLAREVYSIEIIEPLAQEASERLVRLGYKNVRVRVGDGYLGWPEAAPFDAIVVTAVTDHVPPALVEQLRPGGRLVLPLGGGWEQNLVRVRRTSKGVTQETILPSVLFVPMVGEAEKKRTQEHKPQ